MKLTLRCGLLLVALLSGLVWIVGDDPDPAGSQAMPPDGRLTWYPPTGWENFTRVTVPAGGGTVTLNDSTDYLLSAPRRITGPVVIKGGRNVVWRGGHIDIDAAPGRALVVVDGAAAVQGRIVHLEGLLIEGDRLNEGVDLNAARAVVQIQNVRVQDLNLADGGHPDVVQPWGSYSVLRIDKLTGVTDYQGLFLRVDLSNHPVGGEVRMRRVNIRAIRTSGSTGHTLYSIWNDSTGTIRTDQVYAEPHRDGRNGPTAADATVLVQNGVRVEPVTARDGRMTWPSYPTKVQNFDGTELGGIYAGPPPGGDFVPAASVGLSYVPPGYGAPMTTTIATTTTVPCR